MNAGDWYTVLPWAAALSARIPRAGALRGCELVDHMKRLSVEQLAEAGEAAILLVACDFDGTLADIAARPDMVRPRARAVEALRALSRTPHTHVAIVSGRSLRDLRERMVPDDAWGLVGTHGAEMDGDAVQAADQRGVGQLDELERSLAALAERVPGALVERKPMGVAFHYRAVDDAQTAEAVLAATSIGQQHEGLTMRLGSMVIEFLAHKLTKGDAVRRLRARYGATAVVFMGDDLTDEHAFHALTRTDLGIKVGAGDTAAVARVANVEEAVGALVELASVRERWSATRGLVPIAGHSVLSDQRTVALVAPDAGVVWMCLPRIDSPPVFAKLLGGAGAGSFEVMPLEQGQGGSQRYIGDSLVLETRWPGLTVTDYLDCGFGRAFQRAGRTDLIRVIEGARACRIRFAPRLDFGRIPTRLRVRERGLEVEGASDPIVLYSPGVEWTVLADGSHQTAEAILTPGSGAIVLELRAGTANDRPPVQQEDDRRRSNERYWSTWAASLRPPMFARAEVVRSALFLRALAYGPTGALAAAGTTSLPEQIGGQRNWDYRYCWPRDAAMAAAALVRIGNTGTAMRLLDWLARVLDRCESPGRLRPLYTVEGLDLGPEAEIGGIAGYGGSVPVRVGNLASQQVQLDVFGPITGLIALLAEQGAPISPDHWRMTRSMVEAVEARWEEPDHGIWEIRGDRRHHVHSKTMCFHTVDRALVVHEHVQGRSNAGWSELREKIREDVLEHGFHAGEGAFTAAYGSDHVDAAALLVGLTGLVPASDERFRGTVDAVQRRLRVGGSVYRYRYDDGLPGIEGGFHVCTGWLIESLAACGRVEEARALFECLRSAAGPTGAMSEQVDPLTGESLGNTPQAYSHLALINAACAIEQSDAGPSGARGVPG